MCIYKTVFTFNTRFDNPFQPDGNDVPTPPLTDTPPLADATPGADTVLPSIPDPTTSSVASFKAFACDFEALLSKQEQQVTTVQAKSEQLAKEIARLEASCKTLQDQAAEANLAKERLAREVASLTADNSATIWELQLRNDMLEKKIQARYDVQV